MAPLGGAGPNPRGTGEMSPVRSGLEQICEEELVPETRGVLEDSSPFTAGGRSKFAP